MQWTSLAAFMLAAVYKRNLSLTFVLPFFSMNCFIHFATGIDMTYPVAFMRFSLAFHPSWWNFCLFLHWFTFLFHFISLFSHLSGLSLSLSWAKKDDLFSTFHTTDSSSSPAPIEFNETKGKCRKLSFPEFAHSGVVLPALASTWHSRVWRVNGNDTWVFSNAFQDT